MSEQTVIGYIRVSSAIQVKSGNGLDVQRAAVVRWAEYAQVGSPAVFADEGLSGATTDNRPAFKAAMRLALEKGPGAVLVVYKLDRLGRDAIDVQEALAVLLDGGVRVVATADGIDSASGMGSALLKLLTSILAAFSEIEKENIKTRFSDGRARAKADGRVYSGASIPYGRKLDPANPKRLVEDVASQEALAMLKELRSQGMSYRKVAAALNDLGLKPKQAARFTHINVYRLLNGQNGYRKPRARTQRMERARGEFLVDATAPIVGEPNGG